MRNGHAGMKRAQRGFLRTAGCASCAGSRPLHSSPSRQGPFPAFAKSLSTSSNRIGTTSRLNLAQLRAYIQDLTQSGFDTIRLQVSMHKKLAFPLFAFAMALVALPFALQTSERSALWPVGFGLGLTVAFYAVTAFSEQLGRAGQLQPLLAAWAPCALFALGGSYFLLRVRT